MPWAIEINYLQLKCVWKNNGTVTAKWQKIAYKYVIENRNWKIKYENLKRLRKKQNYFLHQFT